MTKVNFNRNEIVFNEAKAKLVSSKTNSEQLENKLSRFITICISFVGGLTAILSFLKSVLFFKIAILILILGFIHALFKIIQCSKTKEYASDGMEASTILNDDECSKKDEGYLLSSLALTYEEKANHNNKISKEIAEQFDNSLKTLEKYLFFSAICMFIGLFNL